MTQFGASTSSISTPSEHPPQVDYMGSALFKAALDGDFEPFNQYQGDLHCLVDGRQNTALHIYFRIGGLEVDKNKREISVNFVKQLVGKCSSLLLQPNDRGEIPLHIAARKGDSDIVKTLIELAKEVQLAKEAQHDEDLEKGLEVATLRQMLRLRDKDGNTATHKAVESGDLDVVRLLMNELDPDFSFSANTSGVTPLYMAVMAKRGKLVDEILEVYKSNNYRSINYYGGPNGRTALHAAVDVNDEESVTKLIEANRPLTKESDAKGRTPLHYAVHPGVVPSTVKLLLQKDASAAYITDKERGMTALHLAAWGNKRYIMEDIISYCPGCCEIVDKRGWNFLHYAVVSFDPYSLKGFLIGDKNKIKDLLLKNLVNEKDINGIAPFRILMFGLDYIKDARGQREYEQVVEFFEVHISEENKSGWFYPSSGTERKQIQQLLKNIANDAEVEHLQTSNIINIVRKVKEEEEEMKVQDIPKHEIEEKARESHLLVAALVATVTFAAAFTVPGGYNEQQGTATLIRDSAFKAFIITNTLAFVASLSAIFLHFILVMFHGSLKSYITPSLIRRADRLTVFSMAAMVVAFSTGSYAVLQTSSGFAITALLFGLVFVPICVALLPSRVFYFLGLGRVKFFLFSVRYDFLYYCSRVWSNLCSFVSV